MFECFAKTSMLFPALTLRDVFYSNLLIRSGRRERSFPATKNFTHELFALGIIAEVNSAEGAMAKPHSGGTAFMITVTPTPGKYAFLSTFCSS